jgi:N-acyl-D-amino-acid deacylase
MTANTQVFAEIRKSIAMSKWVGYSLALGMVLLNVSLADEKSGYDLVIRHGNLYDGSGDTPRVGDVAIKADRIAYVGSHAPGTGRTEVDATGRAVAPGFINMLAHPEESLIADGRALSDLRQGVTLEVMGEATMGPLNADMKRLAVERQRDIRYPVDWSTLGEYLTKLEQRGISPNIASYVGIGTIRVNVLGEGDAQPTPGQLLKMRSLVRQAMEEGAVGVTTALGYVPEGYAKTPELIALASESAQCGGIYSAHIRDEGDEVLKAVDETIEIAQASGGPAEIYHLKLAGRRNWSKLDQVISKVQAARAAGTRITADMYTYTAGSTGLNATMPMWVQEGGQEKWIERMKDPQVRSRLISDMRVQHGNWENLLVLSGGGDGVLLLEFKKDNLKPLAGRRLSEVAHERGVSSEEAAIDLVVEDGSRVEVAYFLMSEENTRREVALPWVSFDSDSDAPAPEGVFLKSSRHPRAYGNFARLFAKYVRDEQVITVQEAVRKLTSFPADTLSLKDRGRLKAGYFADVIVFDPKTIQDHSTYEKPARLATGVEDVWVNGIAALKDGQPTRARSGRTVRGRAWTGWPNGGCRRSSHDWSWSK